MNNTTSKELTETNPEQEKEDDNTAVNHVTAKLDVLAFAVTAGLVVGGTVFGAGTLSMLVSWGKTFAVAIGKFYIAYEPSLLLSFVAAVIAAVDAFILGAVFAWIYNLLTELIPKKLDAPNDEEDLLP